MKLTIVQALRLLKTLREEQTKSIDSIPKYYIPTRVDGKASVSGERVTKAEDNVENINNLTKDIVDLRNAVDKSNKDNNLNGVTNQLQELRKLDNRLDNNERYSLNIEGRIEVSDNGNLIEHELLAKEGYLELKEEVKNKLEDLQDKLDEANSTNTIEIKLRTR